jgi:hypothetical protein
MRTNSLSPPASLLAHAFNPSIRADLDPELYDRQRSLHLNYPLDGVAVVGCGGVGSWAAILLALSGVSPLYLFDSDTFSNSNRNRVLVTSEQVGQSKSEVTRETVLQYRPESMVMAYPNADPNTLELMKFSILLDCTDRYGVQAALYQWSQQHSLPYVRAGYNGLSLTLSDCVPEWGGEATDGYTIVPSWAVPAVTIAALAVAKIMRYPEMTISSELNLLDTTSVIWEFGRDNEHLRRDIEYFTERMGRYESRYGDIDTDEEDDEPDEHDTEGRDDERVEWEVTEPLTVPIEWAAIPAFTDFHIRSPLLTLEELEQARQFMIGGQTGDNAIPTVPSEARG